MPYQLHLSRSEAAIEAHYRTLGWCLYVLNAPAEQLSFSEAFLAYRSAPNIERDFSRLKGRPLGLRILTLTEFVAQRALETDNERPADLYPGNPKHQTRRPSSERLFAAFKEITLTVVQLHGETVAHVTPLPPLQIRILELLDFLTSIYTDLAVDILPNPP